MYIRISNPADNVSRLSLEKLGLSTKRDDDRTIGQFGSGTKFAPIAAMRNGWEWVSVGADSKGPYRMDYVTEEADGLDCIFFRYENPETGEVYTKESSYTAEAGVLGWNAPFQIFREAFCNALDYQTETGLPYSVDIVDEIGYVEGDFAVYLTAADELLEIIDNFDDYFSLNRTPLYKSRSITLYERTNDEMSYIFFRGVRIAEITENRQAHFDYELDHATLNEERSIKNLYDAEGVIAMGLSSGHVPPAIFNSLIEKRDESGFEWQIPQYLFRQSFMKNGPAYQAVKQTFGPSAILVSPEYEDKDWRFKAEGYRVIWCDNRNLREMAIKDGMPSAKDILGKYFDKDFIKLDARQQTLFDQAFEMVKKYDKRIADYPIEFISGTDANLDAYGLAHEGSIFITDRCFDDCLQDVDNIHTLIGTLIHELDHIITGLPDGKFFRNPADDRIADLVMQLHAET